MLWIDVSLHDVQWRIHASETLRAVADLGVTSQYDAWLLPLVVLVLVNAPRIAATRAFHVLVLATVGAGASLAMLAYASSRWVTLSTLSVFVALRTLGLLHVPELSWTLCTAAATTAAAGLGLVAYRRSPITNRFVIAAFSVLLRVTAAVVWLHLLLHTTDYHLFGGVSVFVALASLFFAYYTARPRLVAPPNPRPTTRDALAQLRQSMLALSARELAGLLRRLEDPRRFIDFIWGATDGLVDDAIANGDD